jgi:hypothetical protein
MITESNVLLFLGSSKQIVVWQTHSKKFGLSNHYLLITILFLVLVFFIIVVLISQNSSRHRSPKNEKISTIEETNVSPPEPLKEGSITKRRVGNREFQIHHFRPIPKDGFSKEECEDNKAISNDNSATLRVAVSDGATEGIFSHIWSKLLVEEYTKNCSDIFQPSQLKSVSNKFLEKASQIIANMPETKHWFMYEKLERGTHATIAAVEFSGVETVHISTVGDSCVFWKNGSEIDMLPKLSSEEFGSFPNTICHVPKTWRNLEGKIAKEEISIFLPNVDSE